MTPLVIGIDPGTKQSAYVEWDGRFVTGVATLPNIEVLRYLRTIDRRACVVFEAVGHYNMAVGKSVFDTVFWTGRLFQVARDTVGPTQVSRIKRSVVKKHLDLHQTMSDKEVRLALIRRLQHNPIEWNDLRSHQFAALGIAVTWWDTERERQPLKGREVGSMSDATLFSVPKVGLLIETYHPVKEKRRDEEVMCIRIRCKVQPFDAKLATSIDDGLYAGVRGLLFKLNNPDPKPVIGVLKLNLDCPRQNIELFASPDTDTSRLVLLQTKISGAYARDQKDVSGFAFCFDATHGPVDRNTLEYIHSLVGKQVFASFEASQPDLAFSSEEVEDEDADGPLAPDHAPMFDDDEQEEASAGVTAAKKNTTDRKREKGHRYPKKAKSAKKGKR